MFSGTALTTDSISQPTARVDTHQARASYLHRFGLARMQGRVFRTPWIPKVMQKKTLQTAMPPACIEPMLLRILRCGTCPATQAVLSRFIVRREISVCSACNMSFLVPPSSLMKASIHRSVLQKLTPFSSMKLTTMGIRHRCFLGRRVRWRVSDETLVLSLLLQAERMFMCVASEHTICALL